MDKVIKKYYKKKQRGGRSALAYYADLAALHLIPIIAFYLWYIYNVKNKGTAILLTAVTSLLLFLALALWRTLSHEKFIKKEENLLKNIILKERVMMLPEKAFDALCQKAAWTQTENKKGAFITMRKITPLCEDDILAIYYDMQLKGETACTLCCLGSIAKECKAFILRLPIEIKIIDESNILEAAKNTAGYTVNTIDIDAYIYSKEKAKNEQKSSIQHKPFLKGNIKKYILCAILLFGLSFFAGYSFYYRLIAALCLALASFSFFVGKYTDTAN